MEIDRIQLENVLPEVFAARIAPRRESEIWMLDLSFEKGRRYLVSASSGAGKTSLCAYICGIRSDYRGRIMFDGRDIRTISQADWNDIRQSAIAWLPQDARLFPTLTAVENVMLKASLTKYRNEKEARWMLAELGLDPSLTDRQDFFQPVSSNAWRLCARFASRSPSFCSTSR